ncbi:aldehyde dehydrogenase family protein [Amycolatopsis sp. H20-H5]|uniref:aldehyde dehydrogenase family protein n=1 Tax=Amycolatopsis sp. H20-H5 TaxID=3046309 RepID=UPI002DB5F168|nr:aldehyde dehydrogenase family protein [Amycolatopsis sp. H20-H5]MEC3981015.1 aldehyde dehydrogenase family protein [Amycolatopsis sp. H20-H5]
MKTESRIDRSDLFIGGAFVDAESTARFTAVNPATEQIVGSVPDGNEADVRRAVAAARRAFAQWRTTTGAERATVLNGIADGIAEHADELSALVARQNGAPRWWVEQDVRIAEMVYRNAAAQAAELRSEEILPGGEYGNLICRESIGVVAAIAPWNSPTALMGMKAAAALAAGCTVVVKPAPETSLDSYLLSEICRKADVPAGVVNVVTGGAGTGAALVAHPGIDKVSFTGSTEAGKAIATTCAQALKPVNAELGGKSAAVLLDDADLETFTDAIPWRCLPYSGQVCHSITRIIVPRTLRDQVLEAAAAKLASIPFGDPTDPATIMGPLATAGQRDRVEGYLRSGREQGARLVTGGGRAEAFGTGFYITPTIFSDVDPSMRIFSEEIFGPVLTVSAYDTEDEAVALHDATDFGLSGAVFSRDIDRASAFARRLATGEVLINGRHGAPDVNLVRSFYKHSSLGDGMDLVSGYLLTKSIPRP